MKAAPVFVGSHPPEVSDLSDFTKLLADHVDQAAGARVSSVFAVQTYASMATGSRIQNVIVNDDVQSYRLAAEQINASSATVVSLQYDFRVFWGGDGEGIAELVRLSQKPVVTTFHTLQPSPKASDKRLVQTLSAGSHTIVVPAEFGRRMLMEVYGVTGSNIRVIPQGVFAASFDRDPRLKAQFGFSGTQVICSAGFLSRQKCLENVIRALPIIAAHCPNIVYVILGITDPYERTLEGERYREELSELARQLGVENRVRFDNRHLSPRELGLYLQASDLFVAPELPADDLADSCLANAMATAGGIISAENPYASELLAKGRGLIVPFSSEESLAEAAVRLLGNPEELLDMRRKAFHFSKAMFWPTVGSQYYRCFCSAAGSNGSDAADFAPPAYLSGGGTRGMH